ncbi:MAG: DUF4232 domain-containing protein [Actinomycetota bacterium]|nr:DUF4232 domain-containing protein [Actinomycetota bacterium]
MGMRVPTRWLTVALGPLAALSLGACGASSSTSSASRSAAGSPPSSETSSAASTSASQTTTTTTTTSTVAAGTSALAGCRTTSLRLSFASGQGAAGTAYLTYALTNVGRTCTMIGYPGVAILDAAGHIVQHPAARGNIQAPGPVRLITLEPGHRARFLVTSSDVIPSPGCPHAYTGTMLQVFPPNQRAALRIARRGQFCNLRVGPVQAGP